MKEKLVYGCIFYFKDLQDAKNWFNSDSGRLKKKFLENSYFQDIPLVFSVAMDNMDDGMDVFLLFKDHISNGNMHLKVFKNQGHMITTAKLDQYLLDHCPVGKILIKSSFDFIEFPEFIYKLENILYDDIDFYYLPGFSYSQIIGESFEKFYNDFIYNIPTPQTNFFLIRKKYNDQELYNMMLFERYWDRYVEEKKTNSNLKPWEIDTPIKFALEEFLSANVIGMKSCSIIDKDSFERLFDYITITREADPSHKNIYVSESIGFHCHPDSDGKCEVKVV